MTPRRLSVALLALALVVAACGTTGSPSSTAGSPSSTAGSSPDLSAWAPPATRPALFPVLVTNAIAAGKARILMLYLDAANADKSAPERTVKAAFYDLDQDPAKVVATADGAFVWTIEGERGMYVLDADLPTAGTWGVEFTTAGPGSPPETVRMTFPVRASVPTVQVGKPAPASKSPTAADVGGDLARISTDTKPDPAFYGTSVAAALAAHKPFMVVFATPKFCTSQQCGPTLDHFKSIAAAHPEITFINIEPYKLEFANGALRPVLDSKSQLQATGITDEWGLLSEPWIFAVDRAGIVRGSYEVTITPAELDAILPVLSAGG